MVNKSIQPVDVANTLQSTPQITASRGAERHDGALFSSLFSAHVSDPADKGSGKPLPASGNHLPEQGLQAENQAPVEDVASFVVGGLQAENQSPAEDVASFVVEGLQVKNQAPAEGVASFAVDGPDIPVLADEKLIMGNLALPVSSAETLSSQPARVSVMTGTSQEIMDNKSVMAGQVFLPGQLIAGQNEGQAALPVTQLTEQQVFVPGTTSTVVPGQPAGQVVQSLVQPATEQLIEQPAQPFPRVGAHPPQITTLPAGAAEGRAMTQAVPVDAPVTGDLAHKGAVIEAGQLNREPVVKALPAGDAGRISASQDVASNLVRETVQAAIASQSGNGDLQQSPQGQRDALPGANTLAALTRTDMNPLAFLQTLSESSPLAIPSARVQVPVGQHGWGEAVGQQVAWFVSQNVNAANLRLTPQHLGPVEMQISMEGDKANISFLSQHAVVRDALESSLPRLREMLAESGLDLVNVNISQHGASDQKDRSRQDMDLPRTGSGLNELEVGENVQQAAAAASGLIDAYA